MDANFVGMDSWDRPVYKCEDGTYKYLNQYVKQSFSMGVLGLDPFVLRKMQ